MSVITDIWRQLVRRRLWPVALLLLGALVAVPVLLASDPAPVAPPPPAADAASPGDGLAEPVVSLASTDPDVNGRRHVLGDRKDPFQPAPPPKPKHHASAPHSAGTASSAPSGSSPTGSGSSPTGGSTFTPPSSPSGGSSFTPPSSSSGGGGSTPATPPVSTPAPPASSPPAPKKPRYPLYSLEVRFGDATSTLTTTRIEKLDPLPDSDAPVVIYTGPGADKRSAVFLVDASVSPVGDGRCEPYEADCQRIVLHEGDTEFFDVKDETGAVTATYELDLVDIVTPAGAKEHHARRAHRSPESRSLASTAARVARLVRVLRPSL